MSPDEFMKSVAPDLPGRYTDSKLTPHREAIEKLRAAGYSLQQVRLYLEQCGVPISLSGLSKFIRGSSSAASNPATWVKTPASPVIPESPVASSIAAPGGKKSKEQIRAENPNLTNQQVEDRYVDQFQQPAENSLLRRAK